MLVVSADVALRDALAPASDAPAGLTVELCATVAQATASLGRIRHDVVAVDQRAGGVELVRELAGNLDGTPVILLSAASARRLDLEESALGIVDVVPRAHCDAAGLQRAASYLLRHREAMRELALSEERFALTVRATNDGIWDWDLVSGRLYLSPRWHEIGGRHERSGYEQPVVWFDLVHAEDLARLRTAIDAHLAGHTPKLQIEHRMRHADGSWRWVLTCGLAIRDASGRATRMVGSLSDLAHTRLQPRLLGRDSLYDVLTGLPNRALFIDRTDQALQRAGRGRQGRCAIVCLDIDRFKLVNDSLGQAVGDALLGAVARRLSEQLRPGDTVARIAGDCFALLLDAVQGEAEATVVAERVQGLLERPFLVEGHELFVTASVGIALSSSGASALELLRDADIAMHDARRNGRTRSAVFDVSMHRRVIDRLARENELRQAVENSLLQVHYQPIVELATGTINGFEALARWPAGWPTVPPLDFIPIAEEIGIIGALGLHMMLTSLAQLAAWRLLGLVGEHASMSVNVSAGQLEDARLASLIAEAIAEVGLPADALQLEITESTLMRDSEPIQRLAGDLSARGVGLHLDDFGTGYSSLAMLHRLPVDVLKIDRSLLDGMGGGTGGSDAIVRSTVALAHSLGMQVVAEGVERPSQLQRLRVLGCEYGQGYLFSEGLDARRMTALLAEWSPPTIARLGDRALPAAAAAHEDLLA